MNRIDVLWESSLSFINVFLYKKKYHISLMNSVTADQVNYKVASILKKETTKSLGTFLVQHKRQAERLKSKYKNQYC